MELRLHDVSTSFNQRRGTSAAPVFMMPEELAIRSFELALASSPDPALLFKRLSHVCRAWRELCLESAALCAHSLDLRNDPTSHVHEMIQRSKHVPIALRLDLPSNLILDVSSVGGHKILTNLQVALVCAPSIGAVDLTGPAPLFDHLSRTIAVVGEMKQARAVETIRLVQSLSEGQIQLPALFDEELPRLRHLEMSGFALNWPPPLFSRLTVLDVQGTDSASRAPLAHLVDVLLRLPLLRRLRLETAINRHNHDVELHAGAVRLEHLRAFRLADGLRTCTRLMRVLSLPKSVCLDISCTIRRPLYNMTQLIALITLYVWNRDLSNHLHTGVISREVISLHLQRMDAGRMHGSADSLTSNCDKEISLEFNFAFTSADGLPGETAAGLSNATVQLYGGLYHTSIIPCMRLSFDATSFALSSNAAVAITGSARHVTHLELNCPPPSVFTGMEMLRVLHIERLHFTRTHGPDRVLVSTVFLHWLRQGGTSLLVLRMNDCLRMSDDHAALIGNSVQHFYWDGRENGNPLPLADVEEEDMDVDSDNYSDEDSDED